VYIVVIVQRKTILFHIVDTLHPTRRLTGGLHSGQKQGDENADNGDNDEKFDERETELYGIFIFR
jgi:hypothetical protein